MFHQEDHLSNLIKTELTGFIFLEHKVIKARTDIYRDALGYEKTVKYILVNNGLYTLGRQLIYLEKKPPNHSLSEAEAR